MTFTGKAIDLMYNYGTGIHILESARAEVH